MKKNNNLVQLAVRKAFPILLIEKEKMLIKKNDGVIVASCHSSTQL